MKILLPKNEYLCFIMLITGCKDLKEKKIEKIRLDEKLAKELVSLSVKCVDQKYPYKIGYRFVDENFLSAFYGCWD